ncbi:MAG: hypothetical protein HQK79_23060 [Desulfobacterales bacterium]|nr:hypothetical protein [Desulfobacterales bacterium]
MFEDLNKIRLSSMLMNRTRFKQIWQWRIEISEMPNLDIYAKDITYSPLGIETEAEKVGCIVFNFPTSNSSTSISMTMRDDEDKTIYNSFSTLVSKVVNPDGTVNLAKDYLLTMRKYSLFSKQKEKVTEEWKVIPTKVGDISETKEDGGYLEFTISFEEFRSF